MKTINRCAGLSTGLLLLVALANTPEASAQFPRRTPTPNDTLQSTERLDDNRVTFRIYAPQAGESIEAGLRFNF